MVCINKRCGRDIDDKYKYCPWCGKSQRETPRRKRANGEGSVWKLPDGRWRGQVILKYELSEEVGKRLSRKKTKTYNTRAEAVNDLPRLREEGMRELYGSGAAAVDDSTTVEACYDIYTSTHAYDELSDSQREKLTIAWKRCAPLKDRPIVKVTIDEMQNVIDKEVSTFYPARDMKTILSHCFTVAIKRELLQLNRTQYIELPLLNKSKRAAFTRDELERMRKDYDAGSEFTGYMLIMCYCGLRYGEMATIYKKNVHLNEGYMIGGIKSEAGRDRTIPIGDDVLSIVQHFYSKGKKKLLEMNEDRWYTRYHETVERLGLQKLTPQACRHTYFSELARAGVQPGIITAVGGHTTYQTTLGYTHIPLEDLRAAVNKIGKPDADKAPQTATPEQPVRKP